MWPAACIVPETLPSLGWICPLVPLFSPLVHLSPIPGQEPTEGAARALMREGRLMALSPALPPSGQSELELLERLLAGRDAGRDAAQYGEQLKALFLERLGRGRESAEGAALRSQLDAAAPAADPLWHERLQLVLADRVERENEELAAALARIGARHRHVLATLDEENAGPGQSGPPAQPLAGDTGDTGGTGSTGGDQPWQAKRLRAWARLFAALTPPPRPDMWYLTRRQECRDAILEAYRRLSGRRELDLPELLLPACRTPAEDGESLPRPGQCPGLPGLLTAFSRLQSAVHTPPTARAAVLQEGMALFGEQAPAWNAMIRTGQRAASAPSCRLQLHLLPELSWSTLLQHLGAGAPAEAPAPASQPALSLFGFLQGR